MRDEDGAEQARLNFLDHHSEAAATALAPAVGSGRADHNDLARMVSSRPLCALASRHLPAAAGSPALPASDRLGTFGPAVMAGCRA